MRVNVLWQTRCTILIFGVSTVPNVSGSVANRKLDDLKSDWDQNVTEAIDEAWGQVVLLNGEKVY